MVVQTRIIERKIKVGDLFFHLGIEPRQNNIYPVEFDLKVKTPFGFSPIETLFTTERQSTLTSYLSNGKRITTSAHHLFKSEDGEWKKAEEFNVGERILTEFGSSSIKKQVHKEKKKVLYDMSVRDVHCYYGNGVLNHNSWLSISYAAYAVSLGYTVNYYTLELGEGYVGKRVDCYLSGYNIEEIGAHRAEVEALIAGLPGKLIIKEYSPKAASINTVKAHIQKCADTGHAPELIVIDYLDYLKSASKNKYSEKKDEVDDVFIAAKGLAKELKIPIISPSQVNRMGAKDDIIEGDKAAGSYDKMMVADFCLSLSRKKEDKVLGVARLHVMKNRYGADGMSYNAKLDTNNGRMEIEGESIDESNTQKPAFTRELMEKFFSTELPV